MRWSTKPDHTVECLDCDWTVHGKNKTGAAKKHNESTGHSVRVGVESAIYYETEERYAKGRKA